MQKPTQSKPIAEQNKRNLTFERMRRYKEAGLGRFIVDRSTHPSFYVSAWPVGMGHATLAGKEVYRLPHLSFNSVLVVVLSNEYCEGSWWRIQDMLAYTEDHGITGAFEEMDDMSLLPTDAIGQMRAAAAQMAVDAGFEWCFMIDTDILPEKDLLVKLMAHDRAVVYPLIIDKEDKYMGAPVSSPKLVPGMGLQPVQWGAMSAMLFNSHVFNCLDNYAWHGHDRHFSQALNHFGHHIYVDTNSPMDVAHGPSRHPAKPWAELWQGLERAYDRRQNQDRDRRPPPGFDPAFSEGVVDRDGVYWAKAKWAYSGVRGPMTPPMIEELEAAEQAYMDGVEAK